jgi:hypothetical protein
MTLTERKCHLRNLWKNYWRGQNASDRPGWPPCHHRIGQGAFVNAVSGARVRRSGKKSHHGGAKNSVLKVKRHQPEALMLYDLLKQNESRTRAVWNTEYPEKELERVAIAFGMSFD